MIGARVNILNYFQLQIEKHVLNYYALFLIDQFAFITFLCGSLSLQIISSRNRIWFVSFEFQCRTEIEIHISWPPSILIERSLILEPFHCDIIRINHRSDHIYAAKLNVSMNECSAMFFSFCSDDDCIPIDHCTHFANKKNKSNAPTYTQNLPESIHLSPAWSICMQVIFNNIWISSSTGLSFVYFHVQKIANIDRYFSHITLELWLSTRIVAVLSHCEVHILLLKLFLLKKENISKVKSIKYFSRDCDVHEIRARNSVLFLVLRKNYSIQFN